MSSLQLTKLDIPHVPAEVEKPKSFPTSLEPLIKAWSAEKTLHTFIFANVQLSSNDLGCQIFNWHMMSLFIMSIFAKFGYNYYFYV